MLTDDVVSTTDLSEKRESAPPASTPHIAPVGDLPEISLLKLASVLLRRRLLVFGLAVLAFVGAMVVGVQAPRSYDAISRFMPQSPGPGARQGLAAQFGFGLVEGSRDQSPAFYMDLLMSRSLLREVVETVYTFSADTGTVSGTLMEIYQVQEETAALRRDEAIRDVRDAVAAGSVPTTGIMTVTVTSLYPELAFRINQKLLELVDRFNREIRQSRAALERQFTESRREEVGLDLRRAEDGLQEFLQRNRDYGNSPELTFQHDRLAREIQMQQELFTSISQAFEEAKIEEVRDTPVITIVDPPEMPLRPNGRGLTGWGLVALTLGGILGGFLAFTTEFLSNTRVEADGELGEFSRLVKESLDDLRYPWRPMRRLARGRSARRSGPGVHPRASN